MGEQAKNVDDTVDKITRNLKLTRRKAQVDTQTKTNTNKQKQTTKQTRNKQF